MSDWRAVTQIEYLPDEVRERLRIVWFKTQRFRVAAEWDAYMGLVRQWFEGPCPNPRGSGIVEPIMLEDLPEGAVTARWGFEGVDASALSTVIGDRDRKIIMIAIWEEAPAAAPTGTFVDVVNAAWAQFHEDNSR